MPDTPPPATSYADLVNAIRALAMDAVQKANSGPSRHADGHGRDRRGAVATVPAPQPGQSRLARPRPLRAVQRPRLDAAVRAAAPHRLRPADRASCATFRQLHSKTPGHPEVRHHARRRDHHRARSGRGSPTRWASRSPRSCSPREFNRPGPRDRRPPHLRLRRRRLPDGGHLARGVLARRARSAWASSIALYDDNGISIDGKVEGWFRDDTPMRFAAYGWNVIPNVDGHDPARASTPRSREARARDAQAHAHLLQDRDRQGLAQQGGHGRGARRARWARRRSPPRARRSAGRTRRSRFPRPSTAPGTRARAGAGARERLERALRGLREGASRSCAREFRRRMAGELPAGWSAAARGARREGRSRRANRSPRARPRSSRSRRSAPHAARAARRLGGPHRLQPHDLVGLEAGDARRRPATTSTSACASSAWPRSATALALHGGFIPYSGTFLTFSDYSRNALRMAALMKLRNIFVFTHDSIGLGEDGPTHQSVEHVASLRLIPAHGRLAPVRHGGDRRRLGARRSSARDGPTCARALAPERRRS